MQWVGLFALRLKTVLKGVLISLLFGIVAMSQAANVRVVIGSALIGDVVEDLLGGQVQMLQVTAGSLCPGHNDLKATDLLFAAKADVALLHSFQKKLPSAGVLMDFGRTNHLKLLWTKTTRAWVIPEVQIEASKEIAALLKTVVSEEKAQEIDKRLIERIKRIEIAGEKAKNRLVVMAGKPVTVAMRQSEFCEWAGLHTAASYAASDAMSPRMMTETINRSRTASVIGVVENLQNQSDCSKSIAHELAVPMVVLSNFPGAPEGIKDYFSLLEYNVNALISLTNK